MRCEKNNKQDEREYTRKAEENKNKNNKKLAKCEPNSFTENSVPYIFLNT